jgi:uncharacterized protein
MRTGDWIALQSGTKWFIMDPHPEDVKIADIAHGLSLICRFGGHCKEFYSVAQHSVVVADILKDAEPFDYTLQMYGLVHDASEAFLGDVVRPLKRQLPAYKELEGLTSSVIFAGLDLPTLPPDQWAAVKHADNVALMTERRDLVNHCGHAWSQPEEPLPYHLKPMSPGFARRSFLNRFEMLLDCIRVREGKP